MRPGQLVIHRPSGRRMTIKQTGGGPMVLCCWMDKNGAGELVECSAAFKWEDLRYPTAEEQNPATPAAATVPEGTTDPEGKPETDPEGEAEADAKREVEPTPEQDLQTVTTADVGQVPAEIGAGQPKPARQRKSPSRRES